MREQKKAAGKINRGKAWFAVVLALVFLQALICLGSPNDAAALTIEDEKKLGQEFYDKMVKNDFLIQDRAMNDYITRVGQRVLSSVPTPLFDYRFSIVKSSAVNAFATPGGYVYVNRGLIALAETEGELAAVLAHEIAHVNARHIADMVSKAAKINLATLAAVIAGAFLGGSGDMTAAIMGFSLATAQTMSLKYSRDNEEEADRLGMAYLVNAGYKAEASLNLLRLMRRYEFYSNSVPSYFRTHPGTEDRIRYIDGLLQTTYAGGGGGDEVIGPFRRVKAIMMTGGGDLDSRIRYFESEVRNNPADVDGLYGLGVVQARKGLYRESLATLQRGLALAPNDREILREIGVAYFKLGQYPEAIDHLAQAQRIESEDIRTMAYLGNSYEALGYYDKALEYYRALEKAELDDEEIYYSMGMAYGKLKEMGNANYYFGIYFKKKDRKDTAVFHFKEALKYHPANTPRYQEIEREIRLLSGDAGSTRSGRPK